MNRLLLLAFLLLNFHAALGSKPSSRSLLLWDDPLDHFRSRIMDTRFGLGLTPEDIVSRELRSLFYYPRHVLKSFINEDNGVTFDKDKFQASLDIQQFRPDEISVRVAGDSVITVEGKHEEKEDEHGYISRHFVRKYVLPKGHDINRVESKLSSDGVLTITAPRTEEVEGGRNIPIMQTGEPARAAPADNKAQECHQDCKINEM